MAEFVNYNKRSIQLPPGCKDLGDLFKPAWLRNLPKSVTPPEIPNVVVLRNESVTEKLGNIEKYVAMVFNSRADHCYLTIKSPDEKLVVSVPLVTDYSTPYVTFIYDEAREKAMRAFFDRHGLTAPPADEMSSKGSFVFPDLPVWCIFPLSPMPSGAAAFSKIASDLFHDFCGMNEQSELQFFLIEFEKAK